MNTLSPPAAVEPLSMRLVVIIGAVLYLALFGRLIMPVLANGELMGPDDFIRIHQVRAWMEGQGWFDSDIHRLLGSDLHWTRIVDVPIAAIAYTAHLFVDMTTALRIASIVWPFMLFLALIFLVVRITDVFAGSHARLLALFFLGVNGLARLEFMPGRVDHHNLQIILMLVALLGLLTRTPWKAGLMTGCAVAVSLAVGAEMLFLIIAVLAAAGLAWAIGGERERKALGWTGCAMIASSPLLFFVTVPPSQWSIAHCDAFSPVYALALAGIGLGFVALGQSTPVLSTRLEYGIGKRLAAGLGVALAVGAVLAVLFPACLGGPMGVMDEELTSRWLVNINEAKGLLTLVREDPQAWLGVAAYVAVMLLVAGGVTLLRWRDSPHFLTFFIILSACILLSLLQVRMLRISMFTAVPFCVVCAGLVADRFRHLGALGTAAKIASCVLLTSYVWIIGAGSIAAAFQPETAKQTGNGVVHEVTDIPFSPRQPNACQHRADYALLDRQPAGRVIIDLSSAAPMLVHTRHHGVSGNYHRNRDEILTVHDFFQSQPAQAQIIAARLGIAYVVACRASGGMPVLDASHLNARIWRNELPGWLEWVSHPRARLAVLKVRQ